MNLNLLKSEMVKKGFNQRSLCEKIDMSESTFTRRLKSGVFKSDEVSRLINVKS